MIAITNTEVMGIEPAIRGMRNPMNSWDKSDSKRTSDGVFVNYEVGASDLTLMQKLSDGGEPHRKYMRMINVYIDIVAPLYWWKEFDTYKVGTVRNSCSTMHKIHAKEFETSDFSTEYLESLSIRNLEQTINILNRYRDLYLEEHDKKWWWQMIQLLPSSYNQKATVMLNYETLAQMYKWRKDHKLTEWRVFCKWIESLPHSELITGGKV